MMSKMGWSTGESLGQGDAGIREPVSDLFIFSYFYSLTGWKYQHGVARS